MLKTRIKCTCRVKGEGGRNSTPSLFDQRFRRSLVSQGVNPPLIFILLGLIRGRIRFFKLNIKKNGRRFWSRTINRTLCGLNRGQDKGSLDVELFTIFGETASDGRHKFNLSTVSNNSVNLLKCWQLMTILRFPYISMSHICWRPLYIAKSLRPCITMNITLFGRL